MESRLVRVVLRAVGTEREFLIVFRCLHEYVVFADERSQALIGRSIVPTASASRSSPTGNCRPLRTIDDSQTPLGRCFEGGQWATFGIDDKPHVAFVRVLFVAPAGSDCLVLLPNAGTVNPKQLDVPFGAILEANRCLFACPP